MRLDPAIRRKSSQTPVCAYHPVTGHNDGEWVLAKRPAHRLCAFLIAKPFRDVAIGQRFTCRNRAGEYWVNLHVEAIHGAEVAFNEVEIDTLPGQ